jgi:hypothetical protein
MPMAGEKVPRERRWTSAGATLHPESKHGYRFRDEKAALALNPRPGGFASATNPEMLPNPEPRALREHFVVPSVGSRDVACAEWPNIRRFEHFLQLLDVVNDAFNVHSVSISDIAWLSSTGRY